MKKIFQLILVGIMIVPMSLNAQDTRSFVKQYRKQDGFTAVTIGKPAMRIISLFAKAGKDKDASQVLKRVKAIQVLAFDGGRTEGETFHNEALAFCDANRYEEMIEVVDCDDTVKIFCKTEGETVTGLIVLNRSNRDSSAEMVCLKGKFTSADLQLITNDHGKNIAGI
jgi:hypothetical protein